MASFSERHGYRQVRTLFQREELDSDTRVDLWNGVNPMRDVFRQLERSVATQWDTTEEDMLRALWATHFRRPRDEYQSDGAVWNRIKSSILESPWNETLDMLEAVAKGAERAKTDNTKNLAAFVASRLNDAFEHNLVAYRFINFEITPVDSTAEAEAVTAALADADAIAGARHALDRAVELLADRQAPDYANSIKESISAVEAVVRKLTNEATLGSGLNRLEAKGLTIHPALKAAWLKMYGWASDDNGIRHGGVEAADIDQGLAKYVLVTCSAFVSFLIEEGRKTGLL